MDIFEYLEIESNIDILCIINSLFCLPHHDHLFSLIKRSTSDIANIFFIIPNIHSKNYLAFKKDNPSVNYYEYTPDELRILLEKHHLKISTIKPIVYADFYGRKEIKYLSRLAPYYLNLLNLTAPYIQNMAASYYLLQIKK